MANELQELSTTIWQFITADPRWWISTIIALLGLFLVYAAHRRRKKEGKWKESIARKNLHIRQQEYRSRHQNRLWWQAATKAVGVGFFLTWLFGVDDE